MLLPNLAGILMAVAALATSAPDAVVSGGVGESRDEFNSLFAAGRYHEALPLAERVVKLTESDGEASADHARALNDLARTQFKLGNLEGAELTYLSSIDWLESTQSLASPQFVAPLVGLGDIYATQGLHGVAVQFYRQALMTSRRASGLFNLGQVPITEALAASYQAVGDYSAAEDERRYVVMISERNFGVGDPRVIPALEELAAWYETMESYGQARLAYERIYLLAGQFGSDNNPDAIRALLGIGRNYRLEYTADPESVARRDVAVDQVVQVPTGNAVFLQQREFNVTKLGREGYQALERALATLEKLQDPPPALLSATLIEMGDWYLSANRNEIALEHYRRALGVFSEEAGAGLVNPLLKPRLVAYRPPAAAIRYRWQLPNEIFEKNATYTLTVTDKGRVQDLVQVATDATDMESYLMLESIQNARYSPRFEAGSPVATSGVEFEARWFDLKSPATPEPPEPPAPEG